MKRIILTLFVLFGLLLSLPVSVSKAESVSDRLKGRILLQVEEKGEAWYIEPTTKERAYLGRPDDAFRVMRELGLGVSEKDFNSFNQHAPKKLSGSILLRVEANGEAYYVNPVDLKMHFLGRPSDAFQVMRGLGLGITNQNLEEVKVFKKYSVRKKSQVSDQEKKDDQSSIVDNKPALFPDKINITWDGNKFIPNVFYVNPGGTITVTVKNISSPSAVVFNFQHDSLSGFGLGVTSQETRQISINAPKKPGSYIFFNSWGCLSFKDNSNKADDNCERICNKGLPIFGRLIVTNSGIKEAEESYKEEVSWECN